MKSEDLYESLLGNLYMPMVFYVPEHIIPDDMKKIKAEFKENNFFNTIIAIDENGYNFELKKKKNVGVLFSKINNLQRNTMKLLDAKEIMSPRQFEFLYNRYLVLIRFYVRISNWMGDNIISEIEGVKEWIVRLFVNQKIILNDHMNDLNKYFASNKTIEISSEKVIKNFDEFFPQFDSFKIKNEKEIDKEEVIKVKSKRKKRKIITDEEAELFLLKSVFNID
ncbi:hypothetical protein [Urechidicola croceus]|uniref:Uncharacterized protein n=1 Tax=Urechidicola croceus TaxID=1850246 RepID=A0A1D8P866_9FLAO|nr:hypothetical protein [Urechidicola croceus]AOW20760.1 hypothetical protein LPB138_08760 [Urechidicola croceus]